MKKIWVLKHNGNLRGLFNKKRKLLIAVGAIMENSGGKWDYSGTKYEMRWATVNDLIIADRWLVNKALIDSKWVVL